MSLFVEYTTIEEQNLSPAPTHSYVAVFLHSDEFRVKIFPRLTKTVDDVLGSRHLALRAADLKSFAIEAGMQSRRHAPSRDTEDI
jgi:hypothetical protein